MLQPPLAVVAPVDVVRVVAEADVPPDPPPHGPDVGRVRLAHRRGVGRVVPRGGGLAGGVVMSALDQEDADVPVEVDGAAVGSCRCRCR